jgi:hypothetical protein
MVNHNAIARFEMQYLTVHLYVTNSSINIQPVHGIEPAFVLDSMPSLLA